MAIFDLQNYFDTLEDAIHSSGDPDRAIEQMRYMRNQFDFAGLKAKEWMNILRLHYKNHGYPPDDKISNFSELCFRSSYREMHYIGLETVQRRLKFQDKDFIEQLEWLIVTHSWWDTVDWLSGLVGMHLKRYPELQPDLTDRWNTSDNFWLVRVSIIFQLKYKASTDFEMLCRYILAHKGSKEFFIRKAQGWSLRQYGKLEAEKVREFVAANPGLSGLTKREALKHLQAG